MKVAVERTFNLGNYGFAKYESMVYRFELEIASPTFIKENSKPVLTRESRDLLDVAEQFLEDECHKALHEYLNRLPTMMPKTVGGVTKK